MKTLIIKNGSETTRYILDDDASVSNELSILTVYKGNPTYNQIAKLHALEWYIEESVTRVQKSLWERIKDAF